MEPSVRAGSLRDTRVPPSNNTILRLDADGREREQRKVSNRGSESIFYFSIYFLSTDSCS